MPGNDGPAAAFLELWPEVFDGDGNVRNCGRSATLRLIGLADGIEPGVSHGNRDSGFMDTEAMHGLRRKLGG